MTSQIDPQPVAGAATGPATDGPDADTSPRASEWVSTGSARTRVLGIVCLVGAAIWAWLGLVATPPDEVQGEAVRLMYLHVPIVSVAYMGAFLAAFASGMWLWKRTQGWDLLAASAVLLGAVGSARAANEWFVLGEHTLKSADPSVEIKSQGGRWKKDVKQVKFSVEGADVQIITVVLNWRRK